jgi:hypothetical protein
MAVAMAPGASDADAAPPDVHNAPTSLSKTAGERAGDEFPTLSRKDGVAYRTPGAAFLDSMLSMFHSMVASAVGGEAGFSNFWITPGDLSPRTNSFSICNALNFNLTSYPDRFAVVRHGGFIYSSMAASRSIRSFILVRRCVKLGASTYH